MGTTGNNTGDLKESIRLAAEGKIRPQFNMPLTAIDGFREKGKTDPLFAKLAGSCDAHNGLWNAEAEKILFEHFGVGSSVSPDSL